jgi:hypothetical protein
VQKYKLEEEISGNLSWETKNTAMPQPEKLPDENGKQKCDMVTETCLGCLYSGNKKGFKEI